MRVFYVIYVSDDKLRSALDAIRVVCAPETSHSAHITVRGPYEQRRNLNALSGTIKGRPVVLHDVGFFFEKGQHTVYFDVFAPGLERIWRKRDYGYQPHLTTYDGRSRARALELYQVLTRYPITAAFTARGLEPLVSNGGQTNLQVLDGIDFDFISHVAGWDINAETLFELGDRHKQAVVERLSRYLATDGAKTTVAHATRFADAAASKARGVRLSSGWTREVRPPADAAPSSFEVSLARSEEDPLAAWLFLPGVKNAIAQ